MVVFYVQRPRVRFVVVLVRDMHDGRDDVCGDLVKGRENEVRKKEKIGERK